MQNMMELHYSSMVHAATAAARSAAAKFHYCLLLLRILARLSMEMRRVRPSTPYIALLPESPSLCVPCTIVEALEKVRLCRSQATLNRVVDVVI